MNEERERLEHLVRLRTAQIEQARSELQRQAMTDMLTALPNRRAIMQLLQSLVDQKRDGSETVGALLCDIDHFKTINDTWGHQTGDEVLTAFGSRLKSLAPDCAGRYGGEEFLVLLRGNRQEIEIRATAIFEGIVAAPYTIGAMHGSVTASAGMAILRPDDTTATLIARADAALYRAKRDGRRRMEKETEHDLHPTLSA